MKKWIIGASALVIAGFVCTAYYGDNGSLRKSGGDRDVVEAYYADLVDKNSALKQMEKEIQSNEKNVYEMESKFNAYNRPSADYYNDASNKANTIKDATLKATVQGWVTNSRTQYATRITELTRLLGMLRDKKVSQDDYHLALKIAATLPVIEKYQQQNLPSDTEYQQLMKDLDVTIKKLQEMAKR